MSDFEMQDKTEETRICGKNAVLEAFRSGRTVDRLYVQKDLRDRKLDTILREAKKQGTLLRFCTKEKMNEMAQGESHQGVIATTSVIPYAKMEDLFKRAEEAGEPPFFLLLDEVEDPHNLGAILRTACVAGAHGVIIPKVRSAGLTAAAFRASAGAASHVPVVRVGNLVQTMESLKKQGLWFVAADMKGQCMYDLDLTGPMVLVVGNEGRGVSRIVSEHCDYIASIPMHGDLGSLNVSVALGVLGYEIVRQRRIKGEWK